MVDDKFRKLLEIFFCYDRKRTKILKESGRFVAHYTSAETAMKIIGGRSLWLRNAAVMNDYSEIEYGKAMMAPALEGELGVRYRAALDAIGKGIADRVLKLHEGHRSHARESIFTASLSEHDAGDIYGQLSMWRAYGGPTAGVALIFHGWVTDLEIESLQVGVSPILYGGTEQFVTEFSEAIELLEKNINFLKEFEPDVIASVAAQLLQISMFSIKHPGFAEEREWRVIHRPYEYASAMVMPVNVTLGGIPQTIYELPFHSPAKGEEFNLPALDLNKILAAVMLGPCAYPETVFRALRDQLFAAGVDQPEKRIIVSNIPLRQQW